MKLTPRQYRTFRRIQKKYNVSVPFILSNMDNIRKFVWYAMCPRLVIKRMAVRHQPGQRIVLEHYRLRRVLFDQSLLKIIKRRKRNVRLWSKSMVQYLRRTVGVQEHVEDHLIQSPAKMCAEDVNRQLKEQLELLKSGKRTIPLLNNTLTKDAEKKLTADCKTDDVRLSAPLVFESLKISEMTPEKQIILDNKDMNDADILANLHKRRESESTDKTEACDESTKSCEKVKFLDMLMSKVNSNTSTVKDQSVDQSQIKTPLARVETEPDMSVSSNEDFAGFEESNQRKRDEFAPTMLPTPLVTSDNRIFESEKLDKFLKANDLAVKINECFEENDAVVLKKKVKQQQLPLITNGLVRLHSKPPAMEKPLVPPSLQRLRTVAERRQYLQRHARNYKLAIINNEATIYRELQRKSKRRSNSVLSLQSADNQVPFTREGWRVASYLTTEVNKYYFQVLPVNDMRTCVQLPGVTGNNAEYYLKPYLSRVELKSAMQCPFNCVDAAIARKLKLMKSQFKNSKLMGRPLRAVLPACPLSHKPFQKPLDDDTLITSGGNMLVVRLPTVELEVFPEVGKPLDEVAQRYLAQELPHESITPEWAEFSVSTLVQPKPVIKCEKTDDDDDEKKVAKECRKSFVFPIPYANERNQILASYVIDRSEKLDESFHSVAPELAHNDFSFRANISADNEDLLVCADMLSEMINCVAISCSENSFIKDDPDLNYQTESIKEETNKTIKTYSKANEHKPTIQMKGNCVVSELRRLDAIIIDAGAAADKTEELQACNNDYCALGCICGSLNEQYPFRQHCGKPRCIIDCVCKSGPLGRIMRLETDGRAITSEAAYQIHQQATASLARNEKKFSATVVITEKGSLFINESQYDRKRRCTKLPKRYKDLTESGDTEASSDYARTPVKKHISLETLSANIMMPQEPAIDEPVFVHESVLEQLKHCTVNLRRLELPPNIEPWCMVHELYKCFCNGNATEGRPVHFYKEKDAAMLQNEDESLKLVIKPEATKPLIARPYYSFEKKERTTKRSLDTTEDDEFGYPETEAELLKKRARGRPRMPKRANNCLGEENENDDLSELKLNYMLKSPEKCRRLVPIPAHIYQRCNASRVTEVRDFVSRTETQKTQLLLNEHTLRSVYFHKQEVDQARKRVEEARLKSNKMCKQIQERFMEHMKRKSHSTKERQKQNVLEKETEQMELKLKKEIETQSEKRKQAEDNDDVEEVKPAKQMKMEVVELSDDEVEQFTLPKITNCYSLNAQAKPAPTSTSTSSSAMNCQIMAELTNNGNKVNKELYSEVMLTMNQLVAKKMQDVDFALKRVCKVIPQPNNEILSLITWTNFLQAFKSMDVFIWQVKMPHTQFLVVTLTKAMPIIEDAVAVVNIIFQPKDALPLMGRMLVDGVNDGSTSKLAIIMQGRTDYWLIKGFLRADERSACPKPTPQTHPLLTRKINVLFTLLMKQRLRRLQRVQEQAQQLVKRQQQPVGKQEQQTTQIAQTPQAMLRAALMKPLQKATAQRSLLKTREGTTDGVLKISNLKALLQNQTVITTTTTTTTTAFDTAMVTTPVTTTTANSAVTSTVTSAAAAAAATSSATTVSKIKTYIKKPSYKDNNLVSNLEMRRVTPDDLLQFHQPVICKEDHRWLVMDIKNDFSHILVHDFRDLMPLDRVQQMMKVSQMSKKIIRLQFCQNGAYDAFVTPSSNSKLYFGPLKSDTNSPKIMLLQSVDGVMMTREQFQKKHNIAPDAKNCTTAFMMLQIHGEIYFEYNDENQNQSLATETKLKNAAGTSELKKMNKLSIKKAQQEERNKKSYVDEEDDCLIIDEDVPKTTESKPMYQFAIQQQKNSLQIINKTTISDNDEPPANHISVVSTRSSFLPLMLPKSTTLISVPAEKKPTIVQQPQQQKEPQNNKPIQNSEVPAANRKIEMENKIASPTTKIEVTQVNKRTIENKIASPTTKIDVTQVNKGTIGNKIASPSTKTDVTQVNKGTIGNKIASPSTKIDVTQVNKIKMEKTVASPSTKTDVPQVNKIKMEKTVTSPSTKIADMQANKRKIEIESTNVCPIKKKMIETPFIKKRTETESTIVKVSVIKQENTTTTTTKTPTTSSKTTTTTIITKTPTTSTTPATTTTTPVPVSFIKRENVASPQQQQQKKPITVIKANGLQIPSDIKITVLNNDNNKTVMKPAGERENVIFNKNGTNIIIKPKINVYSANNHRDASTSQHNKTMPPATKRFNVVKQKHPPQMKVDTRIFSGIISSVQPLLPTFNFKRIQNDYFIKIMNSSILRFTGSEGVSTYLNDYCEKTLPTPLKKFLPTSWRFRLLDNESDKTVVSKSTSQQTPTTPTKRGKYVTILPKTKEVEEPIKRHIKRKSMPAMAAAETIVIED